jgi:streptogramin lyase
MRMQTQRFAMIVTAAVCGLTATTTHAFTAQGESPSSGLPQVSYDISVIASGLEYPTGIAVNARGDLFFTQLPTPGVPGGMGGSNRVSMRDALTGEITDLTFGEPEPTFIDVTRQGTVYWTCKSAGVILRHTDGITSLVTDAVIQPSGIAVQDRGNSRGAVYFTELPTPGVPGGMGGENTVSVLQDGEIMTLTLGEPEPTEIAVDRFGNLYWTCKSAGVILTRNAATGQVSLLLNGLADPTGIALDEIGNIYFTEVPTPGVPGADGGMNRVWKYNLGTGQFTLIHDGDPEPTAVAVSASGKNVYWTCTVAGVIVQAVATP